MKIIVKKLLAVMLTGMLFISVLGLETFPVRAEAEYEVRVTVDRTEVTKGEALSFNAQVLHNGVEIRDLNDTDLKLWYWTDAWNEHTDGKSDAVYSNYDSVNGKGLSADVTFPSEGTYYIMAELQANGARVALVCTTITSVEDNNSSGTSGGNGSSGGNGDVPIGDLDILKVEGLDENFYMGVDISSAISLFDSGVTYKDYDGNIIDNPNKLCAFLKSQGITHIRIRVWNNPYTSGGKGYGGGNNDVAKAKLMADACRAAGLKLLVDFHVSDFWTDPGKQQAPKAWADKSLEEKADALNIFIKDALNTIDSEKNVVDMVQVGNETTTGFVGETDRTNMCSLFTAGINGVKEYNSGVKAVIHVTNPEKGNVTGWAKTLNDNDVNYDILATSYYPYWHGTLDYLKSELSAVKNTYSKDVMVAETSYAYTLNDSDGHNNTVRVGNNDTGGYITEKFSVQGQATSVRNLIQAVSDAQGLGVFYWEPAWLTVGDTTGLTGVAYTERVEANKAIWEEKGSGWASSYATEYDSKDAGKWYGGSAVDNEAMFYPDGTPTDGWKVWNYVKTGAVSNNVFVDGIEAPSGAVFSGEALILPEKVTVAYNKGSVNEAVTWNNDDVSVALSGEPGVYTIRGTVEFSKAVNAGEYADCSTGETIYTLTVKAENLIANKEEAGFEVGSNFTITGDGLKSLTETENPYAGNSALHWWKATATKLYVTYDKAIVLSSGAYEFEIAAQGYDGDKIILQILSEDGEELFSSEPEALAGWRNWKKPSLKFELSEPRTIKLRILIDIQDGGWGSCDEMYLHIDGNSATGTSGSGTSTSGSSTSTSGSGTGASDSATGTSGSLTGGSSSVTDTYGNSTGSESGNTLPVGTKLDISFNNINNGTSNRTTNKATNAGNIKNAQCNVAVQGAAYNKVIKDTMPAGFEKAFSFNMSIDGKYSYTNKKGILEFNIPVGYKAKGRSYMLIGVEKGGIPKLYQNLSTDTDSLKFNINGDSYAFVLVYSDNVMAARQTGNVLSGSRGSDNRGDYYVVSKGDSLSKIARAMNTTVSSLKASNEISNVDRLSVGQKIYY